MKHDFEKLYYEYLAKLILEGFLPQEYKEIILADRPDLRMGENYGIEVTRALYPNQGQAKGIFNHLAHKSIYNVDKRYLKTMEKLEHELLISNEGKIWGHLPKEGVLIDDAVLRKEYLKKAKKHSQGVYTTLITDLFIYSPLYNWLEEEIIRRFMNWIDEIQECPFLHIMVFEYKYLYVYNVQTKHFETITVDEESTEKLYICREKARIFAIENTKIISKKIDPICLNAEM